MRDKIRIPHHESQPLLEHATQSNTNDDHYNVSRRPSRDGNVAVRNCIDCLQQLLLVVFLVVLAVGALLPLWPQRSKNNQTHPSDLLVKSRSANDKILSDTHQLLHGPSKVPMCGNEPCFTPQGAQVRRDMDGMPSFWNFAHQGPIDVSYDGRSIRLNDTPALFLAGSLHPVRATLQTWEHALDEAVRQGLNMITIYVMWSAHQPQPKQPFDWSLPSNCHTPINATLSCPDAWTLADAIRLAASRGFFVHIRLGPYVCAEYSYGGLPAWLGIQYPSIVLRRATSNEWLTAMKEYLQTTIDYLSQHSLWAHQGGPILLAQIENELGDDTTLDNGGGGGGGPVNSNTSVPHQEDWDHEELSSSESTNVTVQDYADWCGHVAQILAPQVVWTMCNGLSANNTIVTFNGIYPTAWLESKGDSGRIQVDQPALWTEDEGGFQIWGDDPAKPSDYFWGKTAREMAYHLLQWLARGGTHINYYMWWGGYNRGRSAAGGIMNFYAADAPLCPSGQRRQPKFDHLASLHQVIADIARVLLASPTALFQDESVLVLQDNDEWTSDPNFSLFRYQSSTRDEIDSQEVVFVENNSYRGRTVKAWVEKNSVEFRFEMSPYSVAVFVNGNLVFDSAALKPSAQSYTRKTLQDPVSLVDWKAWPEPVGVLASDPKTVVSDAPVEQTALVVRSSVSTDYVWYETEFGVDEDSGSWVLHAQTGKANGLLVYVDGVYVGSADSHRHEEGETLLNITLPPFSAGKHRLSILSESFGYGNLVGRFGGSTKPKRKGLTGNVWLRSLSSTTRNATNLVDGRPWQSLAGLWSERNGPDVSSEDVLHGGTWSSVLFDTPRYDASKQALFLNLRQGRGHLWLNDVDLGRYWNTTRGTTNVYSQQYYFLPRDLLYTNGDLNKIVIFDVFGGNHQDASLMLSWIEASVSHVFEDTVGFYEACM